MKTIAALAIAVLAFMSDSARAAIIFDWAQIGNPGNADDFQPVVGGVGGVDYAYRISKHEVTNAQYAEFLNVVDPTGANSLELYNLTMLENMGAFGGISNTGAVDGARYFAQAGREQNPVTFVSFFDAMRFTNWLHNGQGSGNTESGVYTIGNGINEVRSTSAKYWIPSEDEWYKAAYYDPNSNVYYDYPTGTDTVPYSDNPDSLNTPDDTNVANFFKYNPSVDGYDGGYAVSGTMFQDTNPFTDVGAYTSATSPYGTFDQGGNVLEWNEAVIVDISNTFRSLRGGSWLDHFGTLRADAPVYNDPLAEGSVVGFRVAASVPEPSTVLYGALAIVATVARRRRVRPTDGLDGRRDRITTVVALMRVCRKQLLPSDAR